MRLVGSFKHYERIGDKIKQERQAFQLRRQVVSVLLISPDGKRGWLGTPSKALQDGRYNITPPQGGVEKGESVYDAAARELEEELGLSVLSADVVYLGSVVRQLPEDHKHFPRYTEAHHHWVCVHSPHDKVMCREPFANGGWYPLDTMRSQAQLRMVPTSEAKAEMYLMALRALQNRVGDLHLIRRGAILPDRVTAA